MALVQVKLIEKALTRAEKERLVSAITDATLSVVGSDVRQYVWVLLEEVSSGDWSIGGSPITREGVTQLRGLA